jgi:hypothetical protein
VLRCSWRLREAVVGSAWVANMAVSSANVPIVVSLDVGRSDVYSRGPRMLPWGTPEWIWKLLEVSFIVFSYEVVLL